MSVNLSPVAGAAAQFLDNSGNVLTGGKLYTYAAGTTTPQATYTSGAGVTFHTNPIILDAAGRVPAGGEIWLTDGLQYKFVLKDANDVLIGTWDNLIGINSNFLNYYTQEEIQTATAGQTVFTLSTVTYTPGTNSLSVFVDGVNQYDGVSYAYVETNSTTVTFTAGLHVGALVKFTTAVTLSSGVTNASLVTYDPPFTASVPTTVELKLAQTISVKDFGATGDGVTDDTLAIQNAILAAKNNYNQLIYFPAANYLVTDTLSLHGGAQLLGDAQNYGGAATDSINGLPNAVKTTVITFKPSVQKSLFEMDGAPNSGSNYVGVSVNGFNIIGNTSASNYWRAQYSDTSPVVTTSLYAFNLTNVAYSRFSNLSIRNFVAGIYADATQVNTFDGIYINFCRTHCLIYGGTVPTSDVWTTCTFRTSPIAVEGLAGQSVQIRFQNCLFESCDNYGLVLCREGRSWSFVDCYSENIPADNTFAGAMFNVGFTGTSFPPGTNVGNALTVIGGQYGGNNSASLLSNWLETDYCWGVQVSCPFVQRWKYVVSTTANTVDYHIGTFGVQWVQGTGFYTGTISKLVGFYDNAANNSGNNFTNLRVGNINAQFGIVAASYKAADNVYTNLGDSSGFVVPSADASIGLGVSNLRWTTIYATNGTINTSDANEKEQITQLTLKEQSVAKSIKGLIKTFKFKDSVKEKGENARIHVGVIAQDIKAAFESEGLVAENYGLFCSDTWTNEDGTKQTRLGIRYDELFAFIIGSI